MEKKNFILVSLDDPRAKEIAKVVGNKTSQKILNYLGENSKKSEQDIALALKIPLNTIGYNIKQLLSTGLIEKTNNFFWSKKGKKISLYQVSNKSIIFSPKKTSISSQIKSILPVSLVAGIGSLLIRLTHREINFVNDESLQTASTALDYSKEMLISNAELSGSGLISSSQNVISLGSPVWWFMGGVILSIVIFLFVNSLLRLEKNYNNSNSSLYYKEKIKNKKEVK